MKNILVVEDNKEYRDFIVKELISVGYAVESVETPISGLEKIAKNKYDVVISDLNLPIMDGVQFTESVKNISPEIICIILTGNPDESHEITSLQNNIDLFIEKRKSADVIIAYIDNLIEKKERGSIKDVVLSSKDMDLELYVGDHKVIKAGVEIELTPTEYEILRILLSNKNKVISREHFVQAIWGENHKDVDYRLVDNHIKNLRTKLRSISIMTVRGYGYRWNESQ